ncbi:DUF4157 domain-containing protein [Segetibacter sp. 3557_3]|uniref:eCIS core domain-containing protein n=1 Tax=Segetibacter sp. 3557_3 TaxID=2547429 RepID=UPI001058D5AA|nr:DUF4157 domain-containing protein [Segetibacter sp. 3557_3]TDH24082.1 DUF4157 domain-containing protein [Segetibacter sp. 3557_3]
MDKHRGDPGGNQPIQVKIRENSWLAYLAARQLKADCVAMVIGRTIHLHNTSRETFLSNKRWVCHEMAHVKQYQQYGIFRFLVLYLLESFRKGYLNNRFEVEARAREHDQRLLNEMFLK